jgi:ATP dependent DNA ligase C terminal region
MAQGPILIFDKSTLQALKPDLANWMDNFFMSNIAPRFFIETLADLEKEVTVSHSFYELFPFSPVIKRAQGFETSAPRTRNGFTLASRAQLFKKLKPLETEDCPFANLPEKKAGRWGAGLAAEKMKECRWLRPKLVGQFEFVEWTDVNYLRHTKFIALRDDKNAKDGERSVNSGIPAVYEKGTREAQETERPRSASA